MALSRRDEPCTVRPDQPIGPTLTKANNHDPLRVLVIEDDAWIRSFVREVLVDEGYVVIEAADGGTGLRLADEHNPDVVLLDLAMPEFTGVDVLHGLKRMARTRHIPVLIHTAWAAVLTPADAAAVAGVLDKPTDMSTLLEAVRQAAASGRSRAHRRSQRIVTYS